MLSGCIIEIFLDYYRTVSYNKENGESEESFHAGQQATGSGSFRWSWKAQEEEDGWKATEVPSQLKQGKLAAGSQGGEGQEDVSGPGCKGVPGAEDYLV